MYVHPNGGPTERAGDLTRPAKGCWYLLIGVLVGAFVFPVLPGLIIYGSSLSGLFSDSGIGLMTTIGVLMALAIYPAIWYFGTIGMYGRMNFFGFLNILVLSALPIGGWVATYYFGKGLYMAITKQSLLAPRSASKAGAIALVALVLISAALLVLESNLSTASPAAPTVANVPPAQRRSISLSRSNAGVQLAYSAATAATVPPLAAMDASQPTNGW